MAWYRIGDKPLSEPMLTRFNDAHICSTRGRWVNIYLRSFTNMHFKTHWEMWTHRHHHDDVIKWKHFPRYWPFVRGILRSPVNSSHKGQWRGALIFSLNCARINGWVNNGEAGDFRRHRAHHGVAVMFYEYPINVSKPQLLTWKLDSGRFHLQYSQLQWSLWRHQMETFSTLLTICAGNSPVSGQWRGALMFSLIYTRINGWVNYGEARLVIWGAVEPIITSL